MKKLSIIVLIILLLIVVSLLVYFFLPKYNQKIYDNGFRDGATLIVQEQTETGNIYILIDNEVKFTPIDQLCGRLG